MLPALLTAAAAFWQFGGLKDAQKASELVYLEEAITSAAKRNDPIEHGYRAHLLQRMQVLHGNRGSAGFSAAFWGFLTLMFLLLVSVSRNGTWWGQLVIVAGLFGSNPGGVDVVVHSVGLYLG